MSFPKLIQWSKAEFSALPWRSNRTLYRTLVSEIMLQQTTVGTVKNHFDRFLKRFPTIKTLADASEEELLVAWKGLGYYRRARSLKRIAEVIVHQYGGEFPHDSSRLQEIQGIGPYTSQALIAIGMDKRGLAVDANLERVIARLFGLKLSKGPKLQKEIYRLFEEKKIFSSQKLSYRDLNESMMDLGRTYCQARKASCELCPVSKECVARLEGAPLAYPRDNGTNTTSKIEHNLELLRIFIIKKDKLLVIKKQTSEWLAGQYEVPTYIISTTDSQLTQYPRLNLKLNLKDVPTLKTGITKYKIKNHLYVTGIDFLKKLDSLHKFEWRDFEDENSNFSTATLKGLKKISSSLL